jgi:hypothetical protein
MKTGGRLLKFVDKEEKHEVVSRLASRGRMWTTLGGQELIVEREFRLKGKLLRGGAEIQDNGAASWSSRPSRPNDWLTCYAVLQEWIISRANSC